MGRVQKIKHLQKTVVYQLTKQTDREGIPKVKKRPVQQKTLKLVDNANSKNQATRGQKERSPTGDPETLGRFVQYLPAAVAMVDQKMNYLACSGRWFQQWGLDSEIIGKSHYQIFPNLSAIWQQKAQKCLAGETAEFSWEEGVKWTVQPWLTDEDTICGLIVSAEAISDRPQPPEQLQLTQLAMDRAAVAVLSFTAEGQICYANSAACQSLDYSCEELLQLNLKDLDREIDGDGWTATTQKIEQQNSLTFKSSYRTKDGRSFPVEVTVNYLQFNNREYYYAFVRDISEQKKARLGLIDAKEQLQAVLDAVPGLVSWVDSDLRYLGVNRHLANAYGMPAETFIGKEVGFLQTSPKFNEFVYEFFASPEPKAAKEVTANVKGTSTTYLIVAQKYHRSGSSLAAAVFVGVDISDRQQMEQALRQSEERYRTLTQNFPNGLVLLFDKNLRYTLAEGQELETLGLDRSLIEGYKVGEVFSQELAAVFEADYRDALAGNCSQREIEYASRIYQVYTLPLANENGEVFAGMMMTQNITDRKRAMHALQESEERFKQQAFELEQTLQKLNSATTQLIQKHKISSLGQLVASVAHEINNPINFISGNISHATNYTEDLLRLVELYQQHYPEPVEEIEEEMDGMGFEFLKEDLPKLLDSMTGGSERIREVVRSLRLFSRVDEAEMKPVDIHEGLDSALLILQNRLQAKGGRGGISAIKEYGKLPKVDCYAGQLNQVFMHLLTNALDALEERYELSKNGKQTNSDEGEPTVWIKTRVTDENFAAISIIDNGPGMTEEICRCIFDPLFSTKPPEKGTGLGLSISRDIIVDKHGGKLYCKSQPGRGAEFVVEIPIERL
jgi:PAS domain S-box-containing protein